MVTSQTEYVQCKTPGCPEEIYLYQRLVSNRSVSWANPAFKQNIPCTRCQAVHEYTDTDLKIQ